MLFLFQGSKLAVRQNAYKVTKYNGKYLFFYNKEVLQF